MSKAYQKAHDKQEVVQALINAVDIISSTMGPNGQTVAIQSPNSTDISVRDGVTVARSLRNLGKSQVGTIGVSRLINACELVVSKAGDGTTSTAILTAAFLEGLLEAIGSEGVSPAELRRSVLGWLTAFDLELKKHVKVLDTTSPKDLYSVALMATSDEVIAEAVSKAVFAVGPKGDVSLQHVESERLAEFTERAGFSWEGPGIVAAIQFPANSPDKRIFLEKATIYFLNATIETQQQAMHILKAYKALYDSKEGGVPPLVIVASGFVGEGLQLLMKNTSEYNQGKDGIPSLLIKQPDWGYEAYTDLSYIFGAPMHGAGGTAITNTKKDSFGFCGRVEAKQNFVSMQALPEQADRITERTMSAQEDPVRLTRLTKGVVQILIGSRSDAERQKTYELVEDAYRTCQSALRAGVVTGGGKTWLKIRKALQENNANAGVVFNELTHALIAIPALLLDQCSAIAEYVGVDTETLPKEVEDALQTDQWFDLIDDTMNDDANLIDSAEIYEWATKTALSVASEIATTDFFITWETE